MKTITGLVLTLAATLLLGTTTAMAQNENEVSFANYTVHYNAFPSEFLEPKISKAVGLKRSASRGVITLAVKKRDGNTSRSVKADIKGTATNLIGQIRRLDMIEVRDGDVVYYVGDFAIARDERLTFKLSVHPDGDTRREEFTFTHQF
jgi:hypothetical protein